MNFIKSYLQILNKLKKENKMKKYRNKYLILLIFLITLNILGIYTRKSFVINISSSIPVGIYKVDKSTDFKRGDIVTFSTKKYKDILDYPGSIKNITFSKYVVGISGDYIRIENNKIYINNKKKGNIFKVDRLNNKLPQLKEKEYIVKEDEVFVLGTNDKSFDSRYYGCIKKSDVIYKLVPLIIWEDI